MDWIIIIIGSILLILGIIGCIIPALPGPPIAYISLPLLLAYSDLVEYPSTGFLFTSAFVVIAITVIDYFLPAWGTKKFGGSDAGKRGSMVGLVLSLFFPIFGPLTILIGPFVGAVAGEIISGKSTEVALRSGLGSFLGFVAGSVLKLMVVGWIAYRFIDYLIA